MTTNTHATTAKTATSKRLASTTAKVGLPFLEVDERPIDLVGILVSTGLWRNIAAEERSRIRRMGRLTFVTDHNTRSFVGIRVGPPVFKA